MFKLPGICLTFGDVSSVALRGSEVEGRLGSLGENGIFAPVNVVIIQSSRSFSECSNIGASEGRTVF